MTKKPLSEMIAVMQAALDGKRIEFCALIPFEEANGPWRLMYSGAPAFDWENYEYRVAVEPREFTIVLHGGRPIGVTCAGDVYIKLGDDVPVRETTTIRVREIVDEPAAELEISCKENFVCGGPPEYGFTLNRDTELPDKGQPGWTPGRRNPYR